MKYFAEKVAIVTGGGSGIGEAICGYLGLSGARVIVADRDLAAAQASAFRINACGGSASAVYVDVASRQAVKELIEGCAQEYGRIDLLFNNAGIGINGEFRDTTLEHWERILGINLWGVIYGCHYVYPIMLRQRGGQIINTASLAGLIPGGLTSSYSASKYAVVGFSLTLRAEASQYGIKVNALCPGYLRTNIQKTSLNVSAFMTSEQNQAMNASMRFPSPQDCIKPMMQRIARNQAIIVTPRAHAAFWILHRIFPQFNHLMWSFVIKRMKQQA